MIKPAALRKFGFIAPCRSSVAVTSTDDSHQATEGSASNLDDDSGGQSDAVAAAAAAAITDVFFALKSLELPASAFDGATA